MVETTKLARQFNAFQETEDRFARHLEGLDDHGLQPASWQRRIAVGIESIEASIRRSP